MKIFNKKAEGQVFMGLLVILTIVIFTGLTLALTAQKGTFEKQIGERQAAVLAAAQEAEKAQIYIDVAAQYAYDAAAVTFAKIGYHVDCGSYRGVPVVYGTTDCFAYQDALKDTVEQEFSRQFNIYLQDYLQEYQEIPLVYDNYYLLFDEGYVYGKSYDPLLVPIFSKTSKEIEPSTTNAEETFLSSTQFDTWPVDYDDHFVTSCFGYREVEYGSKYHPGIDIRAHDHAPVFVVADGKVSVADPYKWGRVVVDHGSGIFTEYLHMYEVFVVVGDTVIKGQQIGTSGGRGWDKKTESYRENVYAEHLHFGIIDENKDIGITDQWGNKGVLTSFNTRGFVNPLCYLSSSLTYRTANNIPCQEFGGAYKFCDAYHQDTGIGPAYTPSASTEAMLRQIDQNYGDIIDGAIQGTSIPKSLVIGVIAQESRGNPSAVSSTGCSGIMQFCAQTAYDYDLCDDTSCSSSDYRFDPTQAIPAGVQLLEDNRKVFRQYKQDSLVFAVAAYNGDPGVIQNAILATGKADPTWEDVSAALSHNMITYFSTTAQQKQKVEEIKTYVINVMQYRYAYEGLQEQDI